MNKNRIDFSTVLASSVHDMKNSLSMLLSALDEVISESVPQDSRSSRQLSLLQYEAKRINANLIQLLTIYKVEKSQHLLNVSHYYVYDFLEELVLQNKPLLDFKGIEIEVECSRELSWFFDGSIISGIINTILNNAFRYAKKKVKISAYEEKGYLSIRMEDDGKGYPEDMLKTGSQIKKGIDFEREGTDLGLYFASIVAGIHKNKGKEGFVSIGNDSEYGGACFTISLP